MAFEIYKPGKGYYTRVISAIAFGGIALSFAAWLYVEIGAANSQSDTIFGAPKLYIQGGVAAFIAIVLGVAIYFIMNKPRVADFMIDTENEMKKVNWPSKKEVIGSTWIVIIGTLMLALILFGADLFFQVSFRAIGLLHG